MDWRRRRPLSLHGRLTLPLPVAAFRSGLAAACDAATYIPKVLGVPANEEQADVSRLIQAVKSSQFRWVEVVRP